MASMSASSARPPANSTSSASLAPSSWDAVNALPAKYRLVIHLYYYEGYSVREIGQITKRSETAVQTQLYRARKLLKQQLGEELEL